MSSPTPSSQASQAGLVIAMGPDVEAALNRLDVTDLKRSLPSFKLLIAAITRKYGPASASLAARAYKQDRAAAGIRSAFTVKPATLPPLPQIGKTIDWATMPLWAAEPDITQARANVTAATERLVLDVGRQTITDNTRRDPKATGWARIPEPGCCYFCALLAIRGAVYKHDSADFKTHSHCRCHAEPVFGMYEPTAQIRGWQQLYQSSTTQGNSKKTQREWRAAFNAAQQ